MPMSIMVKLELEGPKPTLDDVLSLPGMSGLDVDHAYGLVCISPKDRLYVVRVFRLDNLDKRMQLSPEILGAYGDMRISTLV